MSTQKKWYAVYTRPKWEKKVSTSLVNRKIENYCPLNRVQKQWSDRRKIIMEPLFTSYVFVHASTFEHAVIKQSDGVINFVHWLGSPAIIRDEEIIAIKDFLEEYKNVSLEKGVVSINDKVRITSGPLIDIHGKVIEISHKTVKIYLPTLGYQMVAEIEKSKIEIINSQAILHPLAS
jgi:transcription antitermination factor NusG